MNIIFTMLYHLFRFSSHFETFNKVARFLVITLELPIINFVLKAAGAVKAISRNSVHESQHFNLFMSDLDFTIVATEKQFSFIFEVSQYLKLIFLNFGEIEFYTPEEWHQLTKINNSKLWNKIYLIRKSYWQKEKLNKASSRYEKLKQNRGLSITLKKLGHESFPLQGDILFGDLPVEEQETAISFPFFSKYLEYHISLEERETKDIHFAHANLASTFLSILPESEIIPSHAELRKIKKSLVIKEYLLSRAALRLCHLESLNLNEMELEEWISKLERLEKLLDV